jgi:hypothetical protein
MSVKTPLGGIPIEVYGCGHTRGGRMDQGLTWTIHPFRTHVGDPKKVGDRHIRDSMDTKSLHFRITKSETPMSGGQLSAHQRRRIVPP